MATRDAVDKNGNVIGTVELPDDASEADWAIALLAYNPPVKTTQQIVYDKITQYERTAPALLREIKTSNTLSGITVAQSAQMFSDFQSALSAIREGAFPTAIYILQNATPSGFVTQPMINDMIARISAKL